MNVETAKRVMALQRQINAIQASAKRGDLSPEERDLLVGDKRAELEAIRSQASLPLKTDPAPKSGR